MGINKITKQMNKIVLFLIVAAVSCQWVEDLSSKDQIQRRGLSEETLFAGCRAKKGRFVDLTKDEPRCCYYKYVVQKETDSKSVVRLIKRVSKYPKLTNLTVKVPNLKI